VRKLVYQPLGDFLGRLPGNQISLAFSRIEEVLGRKLPPHAYESETWWTNNPTGHSQAKAWRAAGFETTNLNLAAMSVTFKRIVAPDQGVREEGHGMSDVQRDFEPAPAALKKAGHSPLFGCMKGTFTIEPGYDLTSPMYTDEEWAEIEKEMEADWDQIEQGISGKGKIP
jgi:hypothetical protein